MLVKIIGIVLYSLIGALDIWFSIDSFREGRYFWFGWFVMMAIWMASNIFWLGI